MDETGWIDAKEVHDDGQPGKQPGHSLWLVWDALLDLHETLAMIEERLLKLEEDARKRSNDAIFQGILMTKEKQLRR
mgnify:CR=1 FL=1